MPISDAHIEATLSYLVLADKIAAYGLGTIGKPALGMTNTGYWVYQNKDDVKPDDVCALVTKQKLMLLCAHMNRFEKKLPVAPDSFSETEKEALKTICEELQRDYCKRMGYEAWANRPCALHSSIRPDDPTTANVMDYLVTKQVIAAWNVELGLHAVSIKFDPSDKDEKENWSAGGYKWPEWRTVDVIKVS